MPRVEPNLPVQAYKSYHILAPRQSHFRRATCEEVDCPDFLHGWRVRVEGLPPEMLHAARNSGRRYVEQHVAEGETWLVFEAGQKCFRESQHVKRLDRPELFVVRDGDHRGNPTGFKRQHATPEDWVSDFGEHQERIAEQIERG